MGEPFWVTGDPTGPVAPTPLKYGPHPDHNAYVWDPNPDTVPSGGMGCLVHMHGGGNLGGSGFTSNTAVPFGFLEQVYGEYSYEYNNEVTPIKIVTIDYPMGMTQWEGMGTGARPLNWHAEPASARKAAQLAVAWVKSKVALGEAPFDDVNPDLIVGGGISAGSTWMMWATFSPPLPATVYGQNSIPKALILGHCVPDVNDHNPSKSRTYFMLNGYQRWFGQDRDIAADAIVAAERNLIVDPDDPAGVDGYHPSAFNELRKRMASPAASIFDIPIYTQNPSNSRIETTPPWSIDHSAAQARVLHEYLDATAGYTSTHYHAANPAGNQAAGNGSDAVPSAEWAYTWSNQVNWERTVQVFIDLGYNVTAEPDPDGGPVNAPTALFEFGLIHQAGGYLLHENTGTGVFEKHALVVQEDSQTGMTLLASQGGERLLQQDGLSLLKTQAST